MTGVLNICRFNLHDKWQIMINLIRAFITQVAILCRHRISFMIYLLLYEDSGRCFVNSVALQQDGLCQGDGAE